MQHCCAASRPCCCVVSHENTICHDLRHTHISLIQALIQAVIHHAFYSSSNLANPCYIGWKPGRIYPPAIDCTVRLRGSLQTRMLSFSPTKRGERGAKRAAGERRTRPVWFDFENKIGIRLPGFQLVLEALRLAFKKTASVGREVGGWCGVGSTALCACCSSLNKLPARYTTEHRPKTNASAVEAEGCFPDVDGRVHQASGATSTAQTSRTEHGLGRD